MITIDELKVSDNMIANFIHEQPEEQQPHLWQMYELIKNLLPNAEERLSWRMPTFWDKHNIIHFSPAKKWVGLYPGGEATTIFKEKLIDYKTTKGSIAFPYDKPLPLDLIQEITFWCEEANTK